MSRIANSKWEVKIDTTPSLPSTFIEIGGINSIAWDNSEEIQENFFLSDGGFKSSDITGGGLAITLAGKRDNGDAGQDFIVGLVGNFGSDRKSTLQLTNTETSDMYTIPCSIEIGRFSGGGAEELETFECTCHSDGAWTASV